MDLNHLNLHNKMYEDACSKLSNIDLVLLPMVHFLIKVIFKMMKKIF